MPSRAWSQSPSDCPCPSSSSIGTRGHRLEMRGQSEALGQQFAAACAPQHAASAPAGAVSRPWGPPAHSLTLWVPAPPLGTFFQGRDSGCPGQGGPLRKGSCRPVAAQRGGSLSSA